MQQQMDHIEEELKKMKEQLGETEQERDRALDQLREMKRVAQEATMKLSEAMSNRKISEVYTELHAAKESLAASSQELKIKEKNIESLKRELEKVKQPERKFSFGKSLENNFSSKEELEILKSERQLAKGNLACAQEGEKLASSKAESLLEEIGALKAELKLAVEAEEKSKKAMDDLALALKEVVTEANQLKEKLSSTEEELEHTKGEADEVKQMLKSAEEKYKGLLDEAKKETELYKNTAERLRLEAEDSLLAWNEKEIGFVNCIKNVEEERTAAQEESKRLIHSLRMAENMTKTSKEENHKLRDILKQALNEANVAKEASGIAREENSQLKDCLVEKDKALDILTQEIESLKSKEAAALENIKELKRLLSEASTKEVKTDDKEQGGQLKKQNSMAKQEKDSEKLGKAFSFDLKELKIPNKQKDVDENPKRTETLKGSIFDLVDSPQAVSHHRRKSSVFTDDGEKVNSNDFDHLDGGNIDDAGSDGSSRKKKALLHRFGDLLRRRSFRRKESSTE